MNTSRKCGAGVVGPLFCLPKYTVDVDQLTGEIRRRVAQMGFDLVDLKKRGSLNRARLQIRIDLPEGSAGGVTVDDCASVSRGLEAWLDDTELLGLHYVLEVSSPGIERPIRWAVHWRRFVGEDVKVRLAGIGRVRATILGVESDRVSLKLENGEVVEPPIEEARDATLFVEWDNLDASVAASRPKIKE